MTQLQESDSQNGSFFLKFARCLSMFPRMQSQDQYAQQSRKRSAVDTWYGDDAKPLAPKRFFGDGSKCFQQENIMNFPMVPQFQHPYEPMGWPVGGFGQWNEQYNFHPVNENQGQFEEHQRYYNQQMPPPYYMDGPSNVNQMTHVSPSTSSSVHCKTPPLDTSHNASNGSFGALSDVSTPSVHNNSLEIVSPPTKPINQYVGEDEVVMVVGGRLAMVGNLTKYKMRVEEIRRRVSAPEYINCSTLSCIFRKAKRKNGSEEMRTTLRTKYGIELLTCQRQGLSSTSFTPMLEEEANVLAGDIDKFTATSFPREALAKMIVASLMKSGKTYEQAMKVLNGFIKFTTRVKDTVGYIRPKISGQEEVLSNNQKLNSEFKDYSSRTHGFGIVNQNTWMREFVALAHNCKEVFLKQDVSDSMQTFGVPPPQYQQYHQMPQHQFYPQFQGGYYNQPTYNM